MSHDLLVQMAYCCTLTRLRIPQANVSRIPDSVIEQKFIGFRYPHSLQVAMCLKWKT